MCGWHSETERADSHTKVGSRINKPPIPVPCRAGSMPASHVLHARQTATSDFQGAEAARPAGAEHAAAGEVVHAEEEAAAEAPGEHAERQPSLIEQLKEVRAQLEVWMMHPLVAWTLLLMRLWQTWPAQQSRGGPWLPMALTTAACPPATKHWCIQKLLLSAHTPAPSSLLLQAAHFIEPGGSSSSSSTVAACAALLLVREEAQLLDLASELETLRAQLNQASGRWN